ENVKNLAAVFGDQDVVQAFDKAAKDLFELTQEEIAAGVERNLGKGAKDVEEDGIPRELARGGIKLRMTKLDDERIHHPANSDYRL
ncbi:MAG: hypothetical protein LBF34_01525, partial [Puniceicoccales bacterium]|nr:hypothetical protein [Puniceicoccales bacterium]